MIKDLMPLRKTIEEMKTLGPMAQRAKLRPTEYENLSPQTQWEIDKALGILDWSGNPNE